MSSLDGFALPPDIRAALVWDVPALRSLGDAAVNLVRAFGPPPWDLNESVSGALHDAALGVVAASQGRVEDAMAACDRLVVDDSRAIQLLGRTLQAWFAEGGERLEGGLTRAIELAVHVADLDDRARVCRKLAVWAFEIGAAELSLQSANVALGAAALDSHLAWSIRGLLWDLGNRSNPQPDQVPRTDELLTQPWVSDLAFDGLMTADLERFRDGLSGVWGGTIRMGQTSMDVLNAAQRQADWAAAPVMRDRFLQLLCAHLLDGAAQSDAQMSWAALSWVLAGGDRVTAVLNRAERTITAQSARELLEAVRRHPFRRERFSEVASGVWRHVDDPEVGRLLDELDPGEPGQVAKPEPAQVWANLLWRDADVWYAKWRSLDLRHQQGAMRFLLPEAVDRLPQGARADLLAAIEPVGDPVSYAVIAAALAISERVDASRWFEAARPDLIAQLADWRRESIPDEVITRSIATAKAAVQAERDEATGGKFGLGGSDARRALGSLVAHLGIADSEAEGLLLDVATDPRISSDDQVQALQGLAFIRKAGLLSSVTRRKLRKLPVEPGRNIWGVVDASVLEISRLYAIDDQLTHDEIGQVVAAARARKRETRLVAVASLEDVLATKPKNTTAAWSLVSAVYDPNDDVLVRALEAVGRKALKSHDDAAAAAVAGVISAYRTGRNRVRCASVWAARALESDYAEAAVLIEIARRDPSFEVRYAVQLSAEAQLR